MKAVVLSVGVLLGASPSGADVMTAEEFEAFAQGNTVAYGLHGDFYGAEQYLKKRRVIWAVEDGVCQVGKWFPEGDEICFQYDKPSGPVCWKFERRGGQIAATLRGDDPANALVVMGVSEDPIDCVLPGLGV